MDIKDEKFRQIWLKNDKPIICKQGRYGSVLVRPPHPAQHYEWVRGGNRNKPQWNAELECWKVPRAWFNPMIKQSLQRYGDIYVVQRRWITQRCAPACWNAIGIDCECSCGGDNHGSGYPGGRWYVVSDTFAFQWDDDDYACRHIRAPEQTHSAQGAANLIS